MIPNFGQNTNRLETKLTERLKIQTQTASTTLLKFSENSSNPKEIWKTINSITKRTLLSMFFDL